MQYFMAVIRLPENPDPAMFDLIPEQREHIDALFEDQTIIQYALSEDRQTLWISFIAEDVTEVWRIIAEFPMIEYMVPVSVQGLMFVQQHPETLPSFSLN
jgi:hypothetical protein